MIEYRKRYVCPFCSRSTTYPLKEGGYSCTKCHIKFSNPAVKIVKITRKMNVCNTYYRTVPSEAAEIRRQLKETHQSYPEYTAKQLSMVCFCGRKVAERFLKEQNDRSE